MLFSEYDIYVSDFRSLFEDQARKFESDAPNPTSSFTKRSTPATSTSQYFEDAIFGTRDDSQHQSIENEVAQYLGDKLESRDTHVLTFWKERTAIYPALAKMAIEFLAIPATSCPSEGQFNKTKRILGPQRSSLSSLHVETLLCVKDWHRLFGPLKIPTLIELDGDENST